MNPGKVIDPFRLDENLKLGVDYNPTARQTSSPTTRTAATSPTPRCAASAWASAGAPTRRDHVPQLPGHPRGEALHPRARPAALRDAARRGHHRRLAVEGGVDALDLCLACKGCTNDCPVNVDMPTYKAEFLLPPLRVAGDDGGRATPTRSASSTRPPGWRRGYPELVNLVHADARARAAGQARRRHGPAGAPLPPSRR